MSHVEFRIGSETGRLFVKSPYNKSFVTRARELNGTWVSSTSEWRFDARDEQRVRDLCVELYGTDGRTQAALTTVRVNLDDLQEPDNAYLLGGRTLCRRLGRDSRVQLGEGVIVLEGGFPSSGGSMKHPSCRPQSGTILEVRDFPEALAREWDAAHPGILTFLPNEAPAVPAPTVDPLTQAVEEGLARLNGEGGVTADPKAEAIANIQALMAKHGISVEDLK